MTVKVPSTTQWQDLADRINSKNKTIGVYTSGNNTTFTLNVPCISPSSNGFIHIITVYCYVNNSPTMYVCSWSKKGSTTSTSNATGNTTTLSVTVNSVNDTTGIANLTFTFSRTVYGGIRVLAIC